MKTVIANKTGFYDGSLVFEGSTFEVEDDLAASWFVDLNPPPEPAPLAKSRKKQSEEETVT